MNEPALSCDVIVIGAGPTGTTVARQLARAGVSVHLIEKADFPRFQIGESFIPYNLELIQELGLEEKLKAQPHIVKRGAEFGMAGRLGTTIYRFDTSLSGRGTGAFNIARSAFDSMLLEAAVEAGAKLIQPATVREVNELRDGQVAITLDDGRRIEGKYLVDASGQTTLLGKQKKMRQTMADDHLRKVAYFGHYTGVKRLAGEEEGMPLIAMCTEGWFWVIPLDETHTSVGLVLEPQVAKGLDLPADQILQWGIDRSPLMRDRMKDAVSISKHHVRADFSYRCSPYAGEGFFLAGDAAMFLDPVFSTGVCVGMTQAVELARQMVAMLKGEKSPAAARKTYGQYVQKSTYWFRRLIRLYYDHSFREMFLHGYGPLNVHRAVITILAGHVFPEPEFHVKWRFRMFELCRWVHQYKLLVPPKKRFSLLAAKPQGQGA